MSIHDQPPLWGDAEQAARDAIAAAADALGPWPKIAPPTSRAAAIDNYPRSGTQRARVLLAVVNAGESGITDHELVAVLRLSPSSVRPRRGELQAAELIEQTSRTRLTDTGNRATVWVATPRGRAAARTQEAIA